ncbi:MAG: dihydrodipicolinate synthase family protein [Thaumarchaeota archaeon]|nr:dihydrodipicolinate synthase family protein [Candidatus Calditenuaceae archaeon]MDW8041942.1 dihydrodipicolinate synthase family protein [Nitrososphaerota archaeon]
MSRLPSFKGVIAATLTPSKGYVDRIPAYYDFLRTAGVKGFFILGTWGEGPRHGAEHRMRVAEKAVESTTSSELAIVHVGSSDMDTVRTLLRHANEIGASAAAVIAPYYYRPDTETLLRYYRVLAESSEIPLLVYNIPSKQGYSISSNTLTAVLEEVGNVWGVKDSSGDPATGVALVRKFRGRKFVAIGADELITFAFTIGANGVVSGIASVFPEMVVGLQRALEQGEMNRALELQHLINEASNLLSSIGVEYETQRSVLRIRGVDIGPPPDPVRTLREDELTRLKEGVAGILERLVY